MSALILTRRALCTTPKRILREPRDRDRLDVRPRWLGARTQHYPLQWRVRLDNVAPIAPFTTPVTVERVSAYNGESTAGTQEPRAVDSRLSRSVRPTERPLHGSVQSNTSEDGVRSQSRRPVNSFASVRI